MGTKKQDEVLARCRREAKETARKIDAAVKAAKADPAKRKDIPWRFTFPTPTGPEPNVSQEWVDAIQHNQTIAYFIRDYWLKHPEELQDTERYRFDLFLRRVAGGMPTRHLHIHYGQLWERVRDIEMDLDMEIVTGDLPQLHPLVMRLQIQVVEAYDAYFQTTRRVSFPDFLRHKNYGLPSPALRPKQLQEEAFPSEAEMTKKTGGRP